MLLESDLRIIEHGKCRDTSQCESSVCQELFVADPRGELLQAAVNFALLAGGSLRRRRGLSILEEHEYVDVTDAVGLNSVTWSPFVHSQLGFEGWPSIRWRWVR